MLLGTLAAGFLGKSLSGWGINRASKGWEINRAGVGIVRTGYGNKNKKMDF